MMEDFDPKAYLAKKQPEVEVDGFDPKAYLSSTRPVSELESGLRGLAQGASLGFADEIVGGAEALFSDKTYEQARDESRANFKKAKEANPKTYLAGEVGGGLATAVVPVGSAATLGRAVILGAGMGGAAGVGASEASNLEGVSSDLLKGAGLGAIGGAAGLGVAKAVPWAAKTAGEKLKWLAEKSAVNATGATGKQSATFADDAGRQLLDRKQIRFGDTAEDIAKRLSGSMDEANDNISTSLSALDKKGVTVNNDNVVAALRQRIDQLKQDPSRAAVVRKLESIIEDIMETGRSTAPVSEGEQIKRGFKKMAGNWMDPDSGAAGKEAYRAYMSEVERAAKSADPNISSIFKEGKKTYGLLAPIEEAAAKRAATQNQSPLGGLGDWAAIGSGGAAGGPVGAAAGLFAKKYIAPRTMSSAAVGIDSASKFLLRSPKMQQLANTNPPAFKALASSLAQRVSSEAPKVAGPGNQPIDEDKAKQSFLDGN